MNPENPISQVVLSAPQKTNSKLIIIVAMVLSVVVLFAAGFWIFRNYFGKPVTTTVPTVVSVTPSPDRGVAPSDFPSAIPIPISL